MVIDTWQPLQKFVHIFVCLLLLQRRSDSTSVPFLTFQDMYMKLMLVLRQCTYKFTKIHVKLSGFLRPVKEIIFVLCNISLRARARMDKIQDQLA